MRFHWISLDLGLVLKELSPSLEPNRLVFWLPGVVFVPPETYSHGPPTCEVLPLQQEQALPEDAPLAEAPP